MLENIYVPLPFIQLPSIHLAKLIPVDKKNKNKIIKILLLISYNKNILKIVSY